MTPTSQFLVSYGELVVFLIVFVEQNGVPFPAAPFLLAAGALAADGYINLFAAILCATVGSVAADSIWFYTGHRTKTRLFRLFPSWHGIQSAVAQRTQRGLILRGIQVLTAAKFLPLGILVPLRAGAVEVGPRRFLLVDALCSLVYASVYVLPGFFFHSQLEQMLKFLRRFGALAFILLLLVLAGYYSSRILKRIRFKKGHAHKIAK